MLPGRLNPATIPAGAAPPDSWQRERAGATCAVVGTDDRCAERRTEIAAISGGTGDRLVGRTALNQRAPFHIVEEEGPLFVRVIEVAESYRAADVEAVNVETKFSVGHEVVLRIEIRRCD